MPGKDTWRKAWGQKRHLGATWRLEVVVWGATCGRQNQGRWVVTGSPPPQRPTLLTAGS